MSKLGVGVGDEFPIDDGNPAGGNASGGPGTNNPDYEARRAEWRRQREAWREQRRQLRDQWRAEWREKKRAFKEEMRAKYGEDFDLHGYGHGGYGRYWRGHHLLRFLFILGLIMIVITLLNHVVVLFGLVVLAGLYLAYRGGLDHFDLTMPPPRDAPKA
jgi:Flp pilus assembly protein TadB